MQANDQYGEQFVIMFSLIMTQLKLVLHYSLYMYNTQLYQEPFLEAIYSTNALYVEGAPLYLITFLVQWLWCVQV